MKAIKINDIDYTLEKNKKDAFVYENVVDKVTDYFDTFDYIFGDYSYGKLRLKGFYDSNNKNKSEINDIAILDNYISDYCAFDCAYFLLKKIK